MHTSDAVLAAVAGLLAAVSCLKRYFLSAVGYAYAARRPEAPWRVCHTATATRSPYAWLQSAWDLLEHLWGGLLTGVLSATSFSVPVDFSRGVRLAGENLTLRLHLRDSALAFRNSVFGIS